MSIRAIRTPWPALIAGLATAFAVGCSDSATSPVGPSAGPSSSLGSSADAAGAALTQAVKGNAQRVIDLFDACDPETFNAALGPGTCTRNGGVRFENFLDLLTRHHSVGAWHFTPPQAQMGVGDTLVAVNRGGETHTFTEVEEFGGGIVADLNARMGLSAVAPECNQLAPTAFIPAGGSSVETEDEEGVEKYQCCIHPWMRTEVRIGSHAH
jgi:hypothetical protein